MPFHPAERNATRMQVFVRDDLVKIGLTEDGEDDLARCFYLVAEAPSGARWAHDYSRLNRERRMSADPDEPGMFWGMVAVETVEAAMEALRARVARHLDAGGKLDPAHWNATYPAYGSDEYQRQDRLGVHWANEVLAAIDAGEPIDRQTEDEARFLAAA